MVASSANFFCSSVRDAVLARMMHVCAMARNCSGRLGIYQDVWVCRLSSGRKGCGPVGSDRSRRPYALAMIRRSLGADLHRLADHRYIGLGLFAGEIDVLSDFLDLSFRRAREPRLRPRIFCPGREQCRTRFAAKAGRVQPTIRAAAKTYLRMRVISFLDLLFLTPRNNSHSLGGFLSWCRFAPRNTRPYR